MQAFKNTLILSVCLGFYMLVRKFAADEFFDAYNNAQTVIQIQEQIGLPSEKEFQRLFSQRRTLIKVSNIYYMYAHWIVTPVFLAAAFKWDKRTFYLTRNMLAIMTMIGAVIHLAFPLAPPRMLPGFLDYGMIVGPSPYGVSVSEFANQIAAMPSLHVGWALIVSLGASKLHKVSLLHFLITTTVVILTGNHFWLDAIVAVILFIIAYNIAIKLEKEPDPLTNTQQIALQPTS